jgi:prephenate dehydrogenase
MFRRVAILGLGLMGGSLGMALRERGLAHEIAGYDAAEGVAAHARQLGAITHPCGSVGEAGAGAELVVLAAPLLALRMLLAEVAPMLASDAIVTDLGSTKVEVTAWAHEILTAPDRFVGGHPMAGSERSGVKAACADLFEGCAWCLTPVASTAAHTRARVAELATRVGATLVVELEPARHDEAVAVVSHLPLVATAALVLTATGGHAWSAAGRLAAGGFRDTTRVASGDPCMARDICLTNGGPLVAILDTYIERLRAMRDDIADGRGAAIQQVFCNAKAARDEWLGG